jgi:8-oxo-dGTP pyrophosphatase MutT (NUDIX family)
MTTDKSSFYEGLPKKRMGSGCLFFDSEGRVLLLQPSYKPTWEIVGGIVENNESPKAACEREVIEEIGLPIKVGGLLVVDYNDYPDDSAKTESLMFIFDGGVLSADDISKIKVREGEILGFAFFAPDALPENLQGALAERIRMAIQQKTRIGAVYLENQKLV